MTSRTSGIVTNRNTKTPAATPPWNCADITNVISETTPNEPIDTSDICVDDESSNRNKAVPTVINESESVVSRSHLVRQGWIGPNHRPSAESELSV